MSSDTGIVPNSDSEEDETDFILGAGDTQTLQFAQLDNTLDSNHDSSILEMSQNELDSSQHMEADLSLSENLESDMEASTDPDPDPEPVTKVMENYGKDENLPDDVANGWERVFPDTGSSHGPFTATPGFNGAQIPQKPIDFFKQFFTDEMFQHIATETNKYAQQTLQGMYNFYSIA